MCLPPVIVKTVMLQCWGLEREEEMDLFVEEGKKRKREGGEAQWFSTTQRSLRTPYFLVVSNSLFLNL